MQPMGRRLVRSRPSSLTAAHGGSSRFRSTYATKLLTNLVRRTAFKNPYLEEPVNIRLKEKAQAAWLAPQLPANRSHGTAQSQEARGK